MRHSKTVAGAMGGLLLATGVATSSTSAHAVGVHPDATAALYSDNAAVTEGPNGEDVAIVGVSGISDADGEGFEGMDPQVPDAGEGGLITPDTVNGTDNRTRVNSTTHYPARAIVAIHSSFGQCTGFFISSRSIVTAGHCVYEWQASAGHHWAKDIYVWPGRNGTSEPYGTCHPTHTYVPGAWSTFGKQSGDYAVMRLDCGVGSETGWFGYYGIGSTSKTPGYISGYPESKSPRFSQWWSKGNFYGGLEANTLVHYYIDTSGGQSGSPLVVMGCGARCAVGVHTDGGNPNSGPNFSSGPSQFFNRYK